GVIVSKKPAGPRSDEWQYLPRQRWETISTQLPAEIDPLGFDKRNRITFSESKGFHLRATIKSGEIQPTGVVAYGSVPATGLTLGDFMYIDPRSDIQVGDVYSITGSPQTISSKVNSRQGWSYENLG